MVEGGGEREREGGRKGARRDGGKAGERGWRGGGR